MRITFSSKYCVPLATLRKIKPRATTLTIAMTVAFLTAAVAGSLIVFSRAQTRGDQPVRAPGISRTKGNGSPVLIAFYQPLPHSDTSPSAGASSVAPEITVRPEDEGLFASALSSTSILVFLGVAILGFLVSLKVRSGTPSKGAAEQAEGMEKNEGSDVNNSSQQPTHAAKAARTVKNSSLATPASLYGAFRIDQEVGKLAMGEHHRMEVLSSRAPDDRRAIETSLVKMIGLSLNDAQRSRVCGALEEYGFVARQCAALLLSSDTFERTSAARYLGEVKSASALPFLLEALHDSESTVRNQAVASIGELKLPNAIGALLDMARQHPDVPASLMSRALSACSLEGFDLLNPIPSSFKAPCHDTVIDEISRLKPSSPVPDLPDGADDEELSAILAGTKSAVITERLEAISALVNYPAGSSVAALSSLSRFDPQPSVRAQAISSLAAINHESVFAAVLIGMADDTREVRAAAARSFSHLRFDRADAYVRLIETADDKLLQQVARACVKAGIVSQALDRLAGKDRRQAYEGFAMFSLLAKAKLTEPIVQAISSHSNLDVRLSAVKMLGNLAQPKISKKLRKLAVKDGMTGEVKRALLQAISKLDQGKPKKKPRRRKQEKRTTLDDGDLKTGSDTTVEFFKELEQQADELRL
ncbi:MAG: HEAT repeat domain-containing protein [Pyrinomonadaceae bacterium]